MLVDVESGHTAEATADINAEFRSYLQRDNLIRSSTLKRWIIRYGESVLARLLLVSLITLDCFISVTAVRLVHDWWQAGEWTDGRFTLRAVSVAVELFAAAFLHFFLGFYLRMLNLNTLSWIRGCYQSWRKPPSYAEVRRHAEAGDGLPLKYPGTSTGVSEGSSDPLPHLFDAVVASDSSIYGITTGVVLPCYDVAVSGAVAVVVSVVDPPTYEEAMQLPVVDSSG